MRRPVLFTAIVSLGTLSLAGCSMGAPIGPPLPPVALPTAPAYLQSDLIGGTAARVKKARAAGIRLLTPAATPDYVGRLESELRRQTAGTGVEVLRSGDRILLRLPATLAFDVGRAEIKSQAVSTVNEIGLTLKSFNQSLVDVLGHTDATGNAASNQALSQRRAEAVAKQLRARGVAAARIATRGYGASQAIADNATEQGRALNRRVELKVVPLR